MCWTAIFFYLVWNAWRFSICDCLFGRLKSKRAIEASSKEVICFLLLKRACVVKFTVGFSVLWQPLHRENRVATTAQWAATATATLNVLGQPFGMCREKKAWCDNRFGVLCQPLGEIAGCVNRLCAKIATIILTSCANRSSVLSQPL